MGRLSGFLIWSVTFLLAVISVCRIPEELAQKEMPPANGGGRAPVHAVKIKSRVTPTPEKRSGNAVSEAAIAVPDPDQVAICRIVAPAGSVIVIGSVDVSGAPHEVSVEAHFSSSSWKLPASPHDSLTVTAERWHSAGPRTDETDTESNIEAGRNDSLRLLADSQPASPAVENNIGPDSATGTTRMTQRRFLIPHFEADAVRQEPSLATAIFSSRRVTVFMDDQLQSSTGKPVHGKGHSHPAAVQPENSVANAARICKLIETRLMDTIAEWIHPVSDLDNDGRLAIVMTDLDRRSISGETPILGCVRERDFQEHATADFAGDIIYLDYRLPQGDELASLLAHELTHAAAASLQLELTAQTKHRPIRIQPWLNEAAAHWVELQFCKEPAGFSDRVQQFQANPAACPIVAPEAFVPLATRRAGSRISAVSFLQRFINEPRNIHRLLRSPRAFDETMSDISGQPFEAIFRSWSIEQCLQFQQSSISYPYTRLNDGHTTTTKVYGTSFVVIRGGDAAYDVAITSRSSARLQVTLLMSGRGDTASCQITAANAD